MASMTNKFNIQQLADASYRHMWKSHVFLMLRSSGLDEGDFLLIKVLLNVIMKYATNSMTNIVNIQHLVDVGR